MVTCRELVEKRPEAGAILLQCSDLPPFAWPIQNATGLPVYDMNTLIDDLTVEGEIT